VHARVYLLWQRPRPQGRAAGLDPAREAAGEAFAFAVDAGERGQPVEETGAVKRRRVRDVRRILRLAAADLRRLDEAKGEARAPAQAGTGRRAGRAAVRIRMDRRKGHGAGHQVDEAPQEGGEHGEPVPGMTAAGPVPDFLLILRIGFQHGVRDHSAAAEFVERRKGNHRREFKPVRRLPDSNR